jgi:hypothetical protein
MRNLDHAKKILPEAIVPIWGEFLANPLPGKKTTVGEAMQRDDIAVEVAAFDGYTGECCENLCLRAVCEFIMAPHISQSAKGHTARIALAKKEMERALDRVRKARGIIGEMHKGWVPFDNVEHALEDALEGLECEETAWIYADALIQASVNPEYVLAHEKSGRRRPPTVANVAGLALALEAVLLLLGAQVEAVDEMGELCNGYAIEMAKAMGKRLAPPKADEELSAQEIVTRDRQAVRSAKDALREKGEAKVIALRVAAYVLYAAPYWTETAIRMIELPEGWEKHKAVKALLRQIDAPKKAR